uniref:Uncharacterized protein n=1 Tax=Oryza brachyantha TaxID=4533 RepID=J3L717_ORYBR
MAAFGVSCSCRKECFGGVVSVVKSPCRLPMPASNGIARRAGQGLDQPATAPGLARGYARNASLRPCVLAICMTILTRLLAILSPLAIGASLTCLAKRALALCGEVWIGVVDWTICHASSACVD